MATPVSPTADLKKQIRALLSTDLARAAVGPLIDLLFVLDSKQQDYGPRNLLDFGVYGVVVRMNDKMERIKHITKKQQAGPPVRVHNESLADSFRDIANYGIIAYLMQTERWPGEAVVARFHGRMDENQLQAEAHKILSQLDPNPATKYPVHDEADPVIAPDAQDRDLHGT